MAYNFDPIRYDGEFTSLQKSHLKKVLDELETAGGLTPTAAPAHLTDSSAGTPGATLAAVTGTTYATDIPAIRNWVASLNAQINALQAALVTAGILT